MNILDFFRRSFSGDAGDCALPEIYPMRLEADYFVKADMLATYTKILTDTVERSHSIPKDLAPLFWDNCVQNQSTEGLVTFLAEAMVGKSDLYLVYVPSVNILRKATSEEQQKIIAEYKKQADSKTGVYISFKNYRRTDMLKIYSGLEYSVLASLHKTVNISKAVQIKVSDLRKSVALADAAIALNQAKSIASALRIGGDVAMDKNDEVTTATPNIEPTEKAINFLDSKRAFILGLPLAYVSGLQTGGIGASGEADMRAIERGLKQYFVSIIEPVCKALFDLDLEFRSEDFRTMSTALEALKTFEITSDENLSRKSKQEILARLFDIDEEEEKQNLEDEADDREAAQEAEVVQPQQLKAAD